MTSNIDDILPLSSLQEALLLRTIEYPDDDAYLEEAVVRLKHPINVDRLRNVLTALFDRHAGLRARFHWEGLSRPVQMILKPDGTAPFSVIDVSGKKNCDLENALQGWLDKSRSSNDIARAPIQICLVQGKKSAALALSWHHILLDGWSLAICLKEIFEDYSKGLECTPERLQTSPKSLLPSKDAIRHDGEFWKTNLQSAEPSFLMASGTQPEPCEATLVKEQHTKELDCIFQITRFCSTVSVTPAALYYTAWGLLVQRWTHSFEALFGTVFSGRSAATVNSDKTVGMFINTLPIRVAFEGSDRVDEAVLATQTHIQDCSQHQSASLADVTKLVNPGARGRVFDSLFVVENYPLDPELLSSSSDLVQAVSLDETTEFPVTATVLEMDGKLRLEVTTRDVRSQGLARTFADLWSCLLEQMIADPKAQLASLQNLSDEELTRRQSVFHAAVQDRTYCSILDRIWCQAERSPDQIALVDAKRSMTYRAMIADVEQKAQALAAHGVRPGDLVGILTERSVETILCLMAIHRVGAAYVPISGDYPSGRIFEILEDCTPKLVLTNSDHTLLELEVACPFVQVQDLHIKEPVASWEPDKPNPDDLAYVIYSSGSTGKPKGIAVQYRAMPRLVLDQQELLPSPGESVLLTSAFEFDVSVFEMWSTLAQGAKLVVPSWVDLLDSDLLARWVKEESITQAWFITSLFNAHLSSGAQFFATMKKVIIGGEALSTSHVRQALEVFPHLEILNGYGPTENTIFTTCTPLSLPVEEPVPIGYAVNGTSLQVLDLDQNLLPVGALGALAAGGTGVAAGYLNRPELDRARFVNDPFNPGKKRFLTGDLVRERTDGSLLYYGRGDSQVKIRGNRLDLSEIEQRLLAIEAICEASVVLVKHQDTERIVGLIRTEQELSNSIVLTKLAEHLPTWAVPEHLVQVKQLPTLSNGKLDRLLVAKLAQEHVNDQQKVINPNTLSSEPPKGSGIGSERSTDRNAIELAVRSAWEKVLDKTDIPYTTSFFEAGGTSLHIIRLKSLLSKALGRSIAVAELFTHVTIADQVRHLEAADGLSPAKPMRKSEIRSTQPDDERDFRQDDLAVIGMAGRFPGATNIDELWELVKKGNSALHRFSCEDLIAHGVAPKDLLDDSYIPIKGLLDDVHKFDPTFFGYSERQANLMDPQVRLLHQVCWDALEASGQSDTNHGTRIGLYAGILANPMWLNGVMAGVDGATELYEASNLNLQAPTALISHSLGLTGPSMQIDTACSTSAVAIHVAAQAILSSDCDVALAGASSIEMPVRRGYRRVEGMIHSKDGYCRPFDEAASGTVTGDGVAVIVLKRLSAAIRDHDQILAVLKASAINNDGDRKVSYTAPSALGQAEVINACLDKAGIEPKTIGLVEAHGTATPLGDPIEAAALTQVFATGGQPACALGSIKGTIGHLNSTAGVAGVIKAICALQHKTLPPNPNFNRLNPEINAQTLPFFFPSKATAWEKTNDTARRAVISSFGIGGTNAHIVLEEAPERVSVEGTRVFKNDETKRADRLRIYPFSASDDASLKRRIQTTIGEAEAQRVSCDDVEFTLRSSRRTFVHRAVALARPVETTFTQDEMLLADWERGCVADQPAQPVFLFPGQGTQYIGMGRGLYRNVPQFARILDDLLARLEPHIDFDAQHLIFEAPIEEGLRDTKIVQPLLFTLELALAKCLMAIGVTPKAMVGHSLGEFTVATLAGVFELNDALSLVALRGRLMQSQPTGHMYSLPMSEAEIATVLEGWPDIEVATINMAQACVIAGPQAKLADFFAQMPDLASSAVRLQTSHAFHTQMMDGMLPAFKKALQAITLRAPSIPYISNVTGTWITPEQAMDPDYWCQHTRQAVRFAQGLSELLSENGLFIEVGPQNVLSNLAKRHASWDVKSHSAFELLPKEPSPPVDQVSRDWLQFSRTLVQLWCRGCSLSWSALDDHCEGQKVKVPGYPFAQRAYWKFGNTFEPLTLRDRKRASKSEWARQPTWTPMSTTDVRLARGHELCVVPIDPMATEATNRLCEVLKNQGIAHTHVKHRSDAALGRSGTEAAPLYWLLVAESQADPLADSDAANALLAQYLDLLKGVTSHFGPHDKICLLTHGAFPVLQQEVANPTTRAIAGAALQARTEHVGLPMSQCDLPASGIAPQWHMTSLLAGMFEGPNKRPYLACRDGKLFVRDACQLSYALSKRTELPSAPKVWVFGGRGGIGSALVEYWLTHPKAEVSVFVRGEISPRQAAVFHRLSATHGSMWRSVRFDANNRDDLKIIGNHLLQFGKPDHIDFAMGVAGSTLLHALDEKALSRELSAKVNGTALCLAELQRHRALHEELTVNFCSSIASEASGGPGQIAYGAANAWLDAIADYCSKTFHINALALGWDTWRDRGMAARLIGSSSAETEPVPFSELFSGGADDIWPSHALGHKNVRTLIRLQRSNDWIVEAHKLGETGVMPATGYLFLALESVKALGSELANLEEAIVLAPLSLAQGEECLIRVDCEQDGDHFNIVIRSCSDAFDDQWTTHFQGKAAIEPPVYVNEAELSQDVQLSDSRQLQSVRLQDLHTTVLSYSGPWECIKSIKCNADMSFVTAELAMPSKYSRQTESIQVHPALLDVAIGLLDRVAGTGLDTVPFSFEKLAVSGPLGATVKAEITAQSCGSAGPSFSMVLHGDTGHRLTCQAVIKRRVEVGVPEDVQEHLVRGSWRTLPTSANYDLIQAEPGVLQSLGFVTCEKTELAADEVEIEVLSSGLSFKDVLFAAGHLPESAGFTSFGLECTGRVNRVGKDVSTFRVGDGVMTAVPGAFRRFLTVRECSVAAIPSNSTYESAAALPVAYLTALVALRERAKLKPGETVLIHSAAGGVGLAAVHIATHLGASVYTTAGTDEKRQRLADMGTTVVGSTRDESFEAGLLAATNGKGVDVVLNALTGELLEAGMRCLSVGGRFVEMGVQDISSGRGLPMDLLSGGRQFIPLGDSLDPEASGGALRELVRLVEARALPLLPATTFGVDEVCDAFSYMAGARHFGKITITHRNREVMKQLNAILDERVNGAFATGFSDEEAIELFDNWAGRSTASSQIILSPRPHEQLHEQMHSERSIASADTDPLRAELRPRPNLTSEYKAARSEMEERYVALLESHLGTAPVGIDDNFFELGATSLDIVQIAGKLAKIEASSKVVDFYKFTTVAMLVKHYGAGQEEPGSVSNATETNKTATKPRLSTVDAVRNRAKTASQKRAQSRRKRDVSSV